MFRIREYFRYRFAAKTVQAVHSPFLFRLTQDVFSERRYFEVFDEIEAIRKEMLNSPLKIEVTDFGAGSKISNSNIRKVSDIAKYAAKPPKFAQILFRLVHKFHPAVMLELGTSLGMSSAHLALGNPAGKLFTFEGCPNISKLASENFEKLKLKNIEIITGNFDETLEPFLEKTPIINFAFIDGNHTKEATLRYFKALLKHIDNDSVLVFDDITWSPEMKEAWEEIINHPETTLCVNLFFIGIVFFKKELSKQHFILKT